MGQSEDCLFLDVYAPTGATPSSRLPVFFFIQGGGLNADSNPNLNGSGLIAAADMDLVVVTFNYRVGPYGFLASKEVLANGNTNVGLFDQRKALEWVQQHISKVNQPQRHNDSASVFCHAQVPCVVPSRALPDTAQGTCKAVVHGTYARHFGVCPSSGVFSMFLQHYQTRVCVYSYTTIFFNEKGQTSVNFRYLVFAGLPSLHNGGPAGSAYLPHPAK